MIVTGRGMPGPLNEGEKSRIFQLTVYPSWMKLVDDWRRTQPDNPNKSEAIRQLVLIAVGKDPKAEPPK